MDKTKEQIKKYKARLKELRKLDKQNALSEEETWEYVLREFGCLRLASRISELKKQGYKINRRMIKVKNRSGEPCYVAEYSLSEAQ